MKRVLVVLGTRPEVIKLAPVIGACRRRAELWETLVLDTGQHPDLAPPLLAYFDLRADVTLSPPSAAAPLASRLAATVEALDAAVGRVVPDLLVAQGDTLTVMAVALVAFYRQIGLMHVEAGLRTGDLTAPWPEEFQRRVATLATTLHCAPTERAAAALRSEGIAGEAIRVTGNPVIDALVATVARERENEAVWRARYPELGDRPLVLVTGHRRENLAGGIDSLAEALAEIGRQFPACAIVYPVHPNPEVRGALAPWESQWSNVTLAEPASYPEFVWLMQRATVIITDSGGVQEEAPALGKPVLVARDKTERPEALSTGLVELVGPNAPRIAERAANWLRHPAARAVRIPVATPFGDGQAGERVAQWMGQYLANTPQK